LPTPNYETDDFKVYDKVWVMHNNKPIEQMIYSKTEKMNFSKNGIETEYKVVSGTYGACDERSRIYKKVFKTKEELIESL
jgi:hypothetical protein